MGKSTAGNLLLRDGYHLIDTDTVARQVVEPGQPALEEIESSFGSSVISPDGGLNRGQLAKIVFGDPEALKKLESILHPRIRDAWQNEVWGWRNKGIAAGFVTIPLLFETNAAENFDAVICVACSHKTQWERLKARGWTADQIEQRLAAQWPVERKIAASDYVLWTETSLEVVAHQLQRILSHAMPGTAVQKN